MTSMKCSIDYPKLECFDYLVHEEIENGEYTAVIYTGSGKEIVKVFIGKKGYKTYLYEEKRWSSSLLSSLISTYLIKKKKVSIINCVANRPFKNDGIHIIESIMQYQHSIKKMKYYKKQQQVQNMFDKLSPLPEDLEKWIADRVFNNSYYFLYTKMPGMTQGYCTHCHCEFVYTAPVKHKRNVIECPVCHFKILSLAEGIYKRSSINDHKYFSLIDYIDGKIILRYFSAHKHESNRKVDIKSSELSRHIITDCENIKSYMKYTKNSPNGYSYGNGWHEYSSAPYQSSYVYDKDLDLKLKDTKFEYFYIGHYAKTRDVFCLTDLMRSMQQYPFIENLLKQGFDHLADNFINSYSTDINNITDNVFDLTQSVLTKVFKLSKDQLNYIKLSNPNLSLMRLFKFSIDYSNYLVLKSGSIKKVKTKPLTHQELALFQLQENSRTYSYEVIEKLRVFITFTKILRYREKIDPEYNYSGFHSDYYDYLNACENLGFNMSKKSILFPKDFKKAHDKATSLVKVKKDEITIQKLAYLYDNLHDLYEAYINDLAFILPKSVDDYITESKELNHCVKNYVKDVINQETTIIFVRNKETPDIPLYTLECKSGVIKQLRAKDNKEVPEEVKISCDEWIKIVKKRNPYAFTSISRIS